MAQQSRNRQVLRSNAHYLPCAVADHHMFAADVLPQTPEARAALAGRFTRVLGRHVEPEAIAEIVVKVCALLADYEGYKRASGEFLDSKVWEDLRRLRKTTDGVLRALQPFLTANPFGPHGSGAFLLAALALGRDAPVSGADPFVARLRALRDAASRAAEALYPYEGRGNPGHKRNKHVVPTGRALELLPANVGARVRNAFLGLVFELAGEPQNGDAIRQLVTRAKRDTKSP
jgi:hypothetical protein